MTSTTFYFSHFGVVNIQFKLKKKHFSFEQKGSKLFQICDNANTSLLSLSHPKKKLNCIYNKRVV